MQATEDGSERQVMVAFAGAPAATIGARPERCQATEDLLLDYDLLDVLEDRFALGQSQTQRLRLQILTLDRLDFASLLAAVFGDDCNLNLPVHGCTS
jgi:hypothetical protein